ncbi:hypothetical protein KUTeg_005128 [Tegillarca granosa]|uniref:RNA helicase n=1 Tax=Tegillarca granosa TaxID=220873 RepID=A0ABQ9FIX1_TEGGR|nr:hypothetical protein KUTeg_005128 [Tegillarca granosa]
MKQIARSSSYSSSPNLNMLTHSSSANSMNKLGSQNFSSASHSLPQDSSVEKSYMYDKKSIGMELDTNIVNNLCDSIDREFPNNSQLEPNIIREDKYSRADNQRPENRGEKEAFTLRSYQEELARPALQNKNSIIVAPTGSGKTHVAMKIIEEHFKKMEGKKVAKVAFIVEQNALADQQAKVCQKHLYAEVKLITGDSQRAENFQLLSQWLSQRDILVVTAMILVNSLASGDVRIQDFTLMVFDECHHTAYKHPFNQIMQRYMDIKYDPNTDNAGLPQVVGLTASVGVGKAKNLHTAKEWVKKIMANLDAEELATVRLERQELSKHVNIPEEEVVKVFGRTKDYFGRVLRKIMETVENANSPFLKIKILSNKCVCQCVHILNIINRTLEFVIETIITTDKTHLLLFVDANSLPKADEVLKPPSERGADQYTQWISGLWKETAKIDDQNARRFFVTCRNYLDIFNKSLIVYADARVTDALTLIKEELTKWQENTKPDETDQKLQKLFQINYFINGSHGEEFQGMVSKVKQLLEHCESDPEHDNPKLEKLKEMIMQAYTENKDMRGIVFVKTRDLVKAIETWMKQTQGLKNSIHSTDKIQFSMTKVDQDNTLEYFRGGKHKLIIATSVAEEGLDIRKCNLVIRYDHVTNEIAMVQSRGRGRAEDSKYVVLAEHGRGTAEKEELNIIRENLMNKAIVELQDDFEKDQQKFKEGLEKLQKQAKTERDLEAETRGRREMLEGEFELRCCRCSSFICFSSSVRKIQDAHHVAICRDIVERVNITKTSRAAFADNEIKTGIGKLNCMKCAYDLGNVSLYKNIQFPVLKIASFLVVDNMDRKNLFKRWKQVPFQIKDLSLETPEEMTGWPQLVDY